MRQNQQSRPSWPRRVLLAGVLLSVLAFSACGSPVRDDYFPDAYHSALPFAELEADDYNLDIYQAQYERFLWLLTQRDSQAELLALYDWLVQEYTTLYTQYSLTTILYYQDVRQEAAAADNQAAVAALNQASAWLGEAEQAALDSAHYGKAFAKATGLTAAPLPQDMERLLVLVAEENELIGQYAAAVQDGFQTEAEGQVWTAETLAAARATRSDKEIFPIEQALYQQEAAAVADIYLALVKNRQEQAQLLGYESYGEYAYAELYGREYTLQDAQSMEIAVKDKLGAAYFDYRGQAAACLNAVNESGLSWDEAAAMYWLGENAAAISPEVAEAYDYLSGQGYYDLDAAPGKLAGMGFTAGLPTYGNAYILLDNTASFAGFANLAHEFGHFLAIFQQVCNDMDCSVDLAECHSQGMEMLYIPYYQPLLAELSDEAKFYTLFRRLDYIVDACIQDEFQQQVYAAKNLDADKLARIYYEVCAAYGKDYPRGTKADYSWCAPHHSFDVPFYAVSYATSALTAVDLWLQSEADYQVGVDRYLTLLSVSTDADYLAALSAADLEDFTTPGYVRRVGVDLLDAMAKVAKHLDK